jgi:hypothetical protein
MPAMFFNGRGNHLATDSLKRFGYHSSAKAHLDEGLGHFSRPVVFGSGQ